MQTQLFTGRVKSEGEINKEIERCWDIHCETENEDDRFAFRCWVEALSWVLSKAGSNKRKEGEK